MTLLQTCESWMNRGEMKVSYSVFIAFNYERHVVSLGKKNCYIKLKNEFFFITPLMCSFFFSAGFEVCSEFMRSC